MNNLERLLAVCEQLLTHSALPQEMLAKYYLLKKKMLSQPNSAKKETINMESFTFTTKLLSHINHAINEIALANKQLHNNHDKHIEEDLQMSIRLVEEYVQHYIDYRDNSSPQKDDVLNIYKKILQISSIVASSTQFQAQQREQISTQENYIKKLILEHNINHTLKEQEQQLANINLIEQSEKMREEISYLKEQLKKQDYANDVMLTKVQKQYEDQFLKLKSQHKSNLDILQLNFDQMVQEARIKIDGYERELEENNVFFAKFAESILPHLEIYEHDYSKIKQNKELNEKDILLDFVNYLLDNKLEMNTDKLSTKHNIHNNGINSETKGNSPFKYDLVRQDQPHPFELDRTNLQTEPHENLTKDTQKHIQSPHFQGSRIRQDSPLKESNLDDLYKQLKDELEISKQTLRDFEKSRTHLQSALKDSSSQNKLH